MIGSNPDDYKFVFRGIFMKKLKQCVCCALAAAVLLTTVGCHGGTKTTMVSNNGLNESKAPGEKAKLTVLIYAQEHEKKAYQKLINKFLAANKDKVSKVDFQVTTQDAYTQKMTAAFTSRKAPDIFYVGPDAVKNYVDNKRIMPLDDMIAKNKNINLDDIWPQIIKAYRYDGKSIGKGKLYALPKDLSTFAYAYNKDLFDKVHLAYPDASKPYTWDEFVKVCQKLTIDSNGRTADEAGFNPQKAKQWGCGFADSFMFTPFVYTNNATFLNKDYTKVIIDGQKNFEDALQYYVDLILKYHVAPTVQQDSSLNYYKRWLAGQIAFYACGTWDVAAFNDKKTFPYHWDLCGWPVGRSGVSMTWNASVGFAVSASTKYPQEALDLISYLSVDKSGQEDLSGATTGQSMQLPNIMSYAKGEYKDLVKSGEIPYAKNIDIMYNYIEGMPKYKGIFTETTYTYNSDWSNDFFSAMPNVKEGKISVNSFCKQIQPKMQKDLDKAIRLQKKAQR
jgi:multiple sugar transport system substrate-binding protein